MRPNAWTKILVSLIFSVPVQCQFEFNDVATVVALAEACLQYSPIRCITTLRPLEESPQEKLTMDRLTASLTKFFSPTLTVMSYTTELYEKHYLDVKMRKKDACVYWLNVALVNNSTEKQISYLSQFQLFEHPYWTFFANRSEFTSLFRSMKHSTFPTKLWIVQPEPNDIFSLKRIGPSATIVAHVIWNRGGGYTYTQLKLKNQKLTGHTLQVGTIPVLPYVEVTRNASGHIATVTGFYGEIWKHLEESLEFKSIYYEPPDGFFGYGNENGVWSGLFSMAVHHEIDVLLNHMTIAQSRDEVVDFLHPIERTKYKIFFKKDAEIFDWLKVFKPLSYPVWISLIIWIILGGTAAYHLHQIEKKFHDPQEHLSLITCIYFVLRALCNQGPEQVPKLWALRICILTTYLLAAIILPSYSASLISVLTVKTPAEPFKELSDILSTDYTLSINADTTDYDFFERTNDPMHQKIFDKSVIKDVLFNDYREAIENVCKTRKTVFFGPVDEVTATYLYEKLSCVLVPLNSEISPAYKTMSVRKHSQYGVVLKKHLFRMIERGLVKRYRRFYFPEIGTDSSGTDIGIGLVDVGAVFIYLAIFYIVSVAILSLELLSWKFKRITQK